MGPVSELLAERTLPCPSPHSAVLFGAKLTRASTGPTNLSQQIRDHSITALTGADRIMSLEHRLDVFSHAFEGYQDTGRLIGRQPEIGESARRRTLAAATYSRVEERLIRELGSETILIDRERECRGQRLPA